MGTALQPDESVDQFVERCQARGALGIQHVGVIAPGRPFTDKDLETLAGAADQLSTV
jgi:hypothetical protein